MFSVRIKYLNIIETLDKAESLSADATTNLLLRTVVFTSYEGVPAIGTACVLYPLTYVFKYRAYLIIKTFLSSSTHLYLLLNNFKRFT